MPGLTPGQQALNDQGSTPLTGGSILDKQYRGTFQWVSDGKGGAVGVIIDPTTGKSVPATDENGNQIVKPAGSSASGLPKIVKGPGGLYSVNADGTLDLQVLASPAPKDVVPGSGTPPSFTPGLSTDPSDPMAHVGPTSQGTPDVPVDVYSAQTARQNSDIAQQNADRAAAAQQWTEAQQKIANDLAAGRLTLDQAQQAATEAHQTISENLQRSAQALTARGQDITQQDAQANQALTARGQNLDYLGKQSYVTAGQYGALQGSEANLAATGKVGFTPSPTPAPLGYDPTQLAASLAQQVLGQTTSTGFTYGGNQAAPAPAGQGGFVPPQFSLGGQAPGQQVPAPAGRG